MYFCARIDERGGLFDPKVKALAEMYLMASLGYAAEENGRTYPGIRGDDFRPYFPRFGGGGLEGCEQYGREGGLSQFDDAFQEIRKQAADVLVADK